MATPSRVDNSSVHTAFPPYDHALQAEDFTRLFGATAVPAGCAEAHDFAYEYLTPKDEEQILLDVLGRVDAHEFSLAGPAGKARWDKGWAENLERFKRTGGDLASLRPEYIRERPILRLNGRYIRAHDPEFEVHWYEVFQEWLFREFFAGAPTVYEFGCGSGVNLAKLATLYPDKRYVGLDWAQPSVDLVDAMGKKYGWRMEGRPFDFFWPDESLEIEEGSVVFTLGALEQTGRQWSAFLGYLLRFRPALVVNIESVVEWYDKPTLVDYAARRFHTARGYWEGFPARLHKLAEQGVVEILKEKRTGFGSLYIEGYNQIVWRPR